MALVKVTWTSTVQYEADIEIDGWEPDMDDSNGEFAQRLADLEADEEGNFTAVIDRQIVTQALLRDGDQPRYIPTAPNHEPEWGDD